MTHAFFSSRRGRGDKQSNPRPSCGQKSCSLLVHANHLRPQKSRISPILSPAQFPHLLATKSCSLLCFKEHGIKPLFPSLPPVPQHLFDVAMKGMCVFSNTPPFKNSANQNCDRDHQPTRPIPSAGPTDARDGASEQASDRTD